MGRKSTEKFVHPDNLVVPDGYVLITSQEANAMLYAFDELFDINEEGKLSEWNVYGPPINMSEEALQALRDRLFKGHEHS